MGRGKKHPEDRKSNSESCNEYRIRMISEYGEDYKRKRNDAKKVSRAKVAARLEGNPKEKRRRNKQNNARVKAFRERQREKKRENERADKPEGRRTLTPVVFPFESRADWSAGQQDDSEPVIAFRERPREKKREKERADKPEGRRSLADWSAGQQDDSEPNLHAKKPVHPHTTVSLLPRKSLADWASQQEDDDCDSEPENLVSAHPDPPLQAQCEGKGKENKRTAHDAATSPAVGPLCQPPPISPGSLPAISRAPITSACARTAGSWLYPTLHPSRTSTNPGHTATPSTPSQAKTEMAAPKTAVPRKKTSLRNCAIDTPDTAPSCNTAVPCRGMSALELISIYATHRLAGPWPTDTTPATSPPQNPGLEQAADLGTPRNLSWNSKPPSPTRVNVNS